MHSKKHVGGVSWSQRYGAQCPECGKYTKSAYKHSSWKNGLKERYHVCPNTDCRLRFQSIAEDVEFKEVLPEPEQLEFLRGYQSRCGIKKGGIIVNQQLMLPVYPQKVTPNSIFV